MTVRGEGGDGQSVGRKRSDDDSFRGVDQRTILLGLIAALAALGVGVLTVLGEYQIAGAVMGGGTVFGAVYAFLDRLVDRSSQ